MPSCGRPRQSCAQVGRSHAMEQIAPLPAQDDETSFLKKLNCFSGKRFLPLSHCTSEQPPVTTGSPEAHAGFPTALTATAVSHGNRGKAAEASWVLASFPGLHLLLSGPGWSQFPGGLRWPLWSSQSPSSAGPSPRCLSGGSGQVWISGRAPEREKNQILCFLQTRSTPGTGQDAHQPALKCQTYPG